jgi:hypothetical protein
MWSGPLAATMFSVPPLTGCDVLDAEGLADVELLDDPVDEADGVEDDGDDELEHAARPRAAVATAASPATRLDTLVMGMFLFGLLRSGRSWAASWRQILSRSLPTGEIVRYPGSIPTLNEGRGPIVI